MSAWTDDKIAVFRVGRHRRYAGFTVIIFLKKCGTKSPGAHYQASQSMEDNAHVKRRIALAYRVTAPCNSGALVDGVSLLNV